MGSDAIPLPLVALERGEGLRIVGDVGSAATLAFACVGECALWPRQLPSLLYQSRSSSAMTYLRASVHARPATADDRASVGLRAAPSNAVVGVDRVGV